MRYLQEHPRAADNLEGIAEWWVMRQQVRVDLDVLKRALRQLVDQDLVEEIGSSQGPLYRLRER